MLDNLRQILAQRGMYYFYNDVFFFFSFCEHLYG